MRGVFLVRGVLGVTLRPPPEAFIPLPESQHPDLTTRERVALQTKPTSCQSCHGIINPLGFTLEHFDAVGRFRDQDNGKPIDATGTYLTRTGETVKFDGRRDLAEFLAGSEEVQTAFVEQLFRHLAKQPVRAYGPKELAELRESFAKNGYQYSQADGGGGDGGGVLGGREERRRRGPPATVDAERVRFHCAAGYQGQIEWYTTIVGIFRTIAGRTLDRGGVEVPMNAANNSGSTGLASTSGHESSWPERMRTGRAQRHALPSSR